MLIKPRGREVRRRGVELFERLLYRRFIIQVGSHLILAHVEDIEQAAVPDGLVVVAKLRSGALNSFAMHSAESSEIGSM